jgi:hypothetical protein
MKVCVIRSYKRLQIGTDIRCRVLHKPVVLVLQRCSGILLCQDLVLSSVTTETLPVSTSHVHGIAKSVTVALGVPSVMVSGLACGSGTRAPLWPILPSTDTRVVSVVLRVKVLRSEGAREHERCPPRVRLFSLGIGPEVRLRLYLRGTVQSRTHGT